MLNNPESNQWKAYAMSKFATALLASNLNKLEGVEAVAVHPGAVKTGMTDKINPKLRIKLNFIRKHLLSAVNNNLIIIKIKFRKLLANMLFTALKMKLNLINIEMWIKHANLIKKCLKKAIYMHLKN